MADGADAGRTSLVEAFLLLPAIREMSIVPPPPTVHTIAATLDVDVVYFRGTDDVLWRVNIDGWHQSAKGG